MTKKEIIAGLQRAEHGACCKCLHHGEGQYHGGSDECPVEIMVGNAINAAIDIVRSYAAVEPSPKEKS